eukprot:TRINITY_DN8144_c0_g1_i3.p1 TRINITY_DN8144_c0_g1~~TRINITY_DN8144_c0_g1_i3.p1  ORF type:complete len:184 (+),score=39.73 TRINITY_DN8144_c0_g1_i3:45-596(+)
MGKGCCAGKKNRDASDPNHTLGISGGPNRPLDLTIGAAFATKNHIRGSQTTKFEIWDTAGQERYHSLAPMYYRGSFAALIVFDITQYYTFEKAKAWITELRTNCPTIIALYIVGCKLDLEKNRAVETNEAQHFATDNNCHFTELSAKTGKNVAELFDSISKMLHGQYSQTKKDEADLTDQTED